MNVINVTKLNSIPQFVVDHVGSIAVDEKGRYIQKNTLNLYLVILVFSIACNTLLSRLETDEVVQHMF